MKAPVLALGIATAAFAASTVYLWTQLHEERARVAQVESTTREIRQRLAQLEKARVEVAGHRNANTGGYRTGQITQGNPAVALPPPPSHSPDPERRAEWARNAQPPKPPAALQRAMHSQLRANNRRQYAEFCEEIGLSKETTESLIALMAENEAQLFIPSFNDPVDYQRQLEQRQRENDAEIAALIGPENAQALKDYQASLPARAEADMLASQLEGNEVPLNKEQMKRLNEVFIDERARVPMPEIMIDADTGKYLTSLRDWQDDYNRRVSDRVGSVLNAEQLRIYTEIQQWQSQLRDGYGVFGEGVAISDVQAGAGTDVVTFRASGAVMATQPLTIAVPAPDRPNEDE
jgi:hypothetical protein